jgi:hypothetical protein
VGIVVSHEKALEKHHLVVAWSAFQNHSTRGCLDNANPTPDAGCHNHICYISLYAHQALKLCT